MADAADLKSAGDSSPCRFESGPRHSLNCDRHAESRNPPITTSIPVSLITCPDGFKKTSGALSSKNPCPRLRPVHQIGPGPGSAQGGVRTGPHAGGHVRTCSGAKPGLCAGASSTLADG